ncbi:unnamed protein product, partial [Brugia timori]|uniref:Secreted protein n=1 Tax=Brugia timori TaxID=42155 RepID=A0A0R3QIW5_9BILA
MGGPPGASPGGLGPSALEVLAQLQAALEAQRMRVLLLGARIHGRHLLLALLRLGQQRGRQVQHALDLVVLRLRDAPHAEQPEGIALDVQQQRLVAGEVLRLRQQRAPRGGAVVAHVVVLPGRPGQHRGAARQLEVGAVAVHHEGLALRHRVAIGERDGHGPGRGRVLVLVRERLLRDSHVGAVARALRVDREQRHAGLANQAVADGTHLLVGGLLERAPQPRGRDVAIGIVLQVDLQALLHCLLADVVLDRLEHVAALVVDEDRRADEAERTR